MILAKCKNSRNIVRIESCKYIKNIDGEVLYFIKNDFGFKRAIPESLYNRLVAKNKIKIICWQNKKNIIFYVWNK